MTEEQQEVPSQMLIKFAGFGSALFEVQYQNVASRQLYSVIAFLQDMVRELSENERRQKEQMGIQVPPEGTIFKP